MGEKQISGDLSTITPREFISDHLIWGILLFLNYKRFLFVPIDGCSEGQSKWILFICVAHASFAGVFIRWKRYMTTRSILADVMIGIGFYCVLACGRYYENWTRIIFILFAGVSFWYTYMVFTRKVRGKSLTEISGEYRSFIVKRRIFRVLNVNGLILGMVMVLFIIPIAYDRIVNGNVIVSETQTYEIKGFNIDYAENEYGLSNNIDSISKIRSDETWMPLSLSEKLAVLQDVCNCETNYFGIELIPVMVEEIEGNTRGYYMDSERKIVLSRELVEEELCFITLWCLLHEVYHSYQHSLVKLFLCADDSQRKLRVFRHCAEYIEEMEDYHYGEGDEEEFELYYNQYMEADSREYATETVQVYYSEIDRILNEQKTIAEKEE